MKLFTFFLLLFGFTTFCLGQSKNDNKPNFSGTWQLTDTKNAARIDGYKETRIVVYQEPEIKITIKFNKNNNEKTSETKYYSDGRGETNPSISDNQIFNTKTKWDGKALKVQRTKEITAPDNTKIKLTIIEKWEISKDGKTLTETTTVSAPFGGKTVNTIGDGSPAKRFFSRVE